MDYVETMAALEAAGTAQNRKVYARYGAREPMYGVSWATLRALHKRIKTDHALALQLWASGNYDAMILASLIADPRQADRCLLDNWLADAGCQPLAAQVSDYAGRTALAGAVAAAWARSDDEWIGYAGWSVIGRQALDDPSLPDDYFVPCLEAIERTIHGAPNFTRYAMNNALIAIGTHSPALRTLATAAAGRIGKVHVDYGQTDCKTPDAVPYIDKAWAHKERPRVSRKAAAAPA